MPPPTLEPARVSSPTAVVAALARERRRVAADLVALTKPRVVLMVLVTTVVGYYVGLTGAPDYARLVHLVIGTMLAAGGTLALNQYWERDVDTRMDRTPVPRRLRPGWGPAPSGRRRRRHLDRAADRHRLPGAARRQPAADLDRPGRSDLLCRGVRPRRGLRRAGDPPGAVAVGRRGPARPVRVAALSAHSAGPARLRQGMTSDARNRQTLRLLLTIIAALIVSAFLIGIRW